MSSRVTIKQFTDEMTGSFVAPFTPEHAIYDTAGKRLDIKIAGLDLDRISSALTSSEQAISAQTKESLAAVVNEQKEDRARLDTLESKASNLDNYTRVYDATAASGNSTKYTIEQLLADNATLIPTEYHVAGLTLKFVDSATSKYVSYVLTTPTWSTSTADWQYSNKNIEYAKNGTGVTVPKGKVVYINSSTGENPIFQLATNADYTIASRAWGVTMDSIDNNAVGKIIHFGMIENIDTSAYTVGTELWLGTNGEYTSVRPTSPAFQTSIGMVIRQSATVGSIFVNIRYVNIEGIRSQNTNTAPSSKLLDDELVQVRSDLNNSHDQIANLQSEKEDKASKQIISDVEYGALVASGEILPDVLYYTYEA